MVKIPFDFVKDGKKHYISLVGGGGKTTLMYELAAYYASVGKRAVALTSTHIMLPKRLELWAKEEAKLMELLQKGSFAVIGELEEATGKLIAPKEELYELALAKADIVICEADGAKRLPIKAPRKQEPVIPAEADIVIGVVGLDALGKPWQEVCFGLAKAQELLGVQAGDNVGVEKLAQLLLSEQGTRKGIENRKYYIVLNKLDLLQAKAEAECLKNLLIAGGIAAGHIWIRGK